MNLTSKIKNIFFCKSIQACLFIVAIFLVPAVGQSGQIVDSIIEHIDQIPTVSYCNNANPDRIRLVKKTWTCTTNKSRLVHSAASMISLGKALEKVNDENSPRGIYLIDRLNHYYDKAREADYQLRRNKCTRACF